jgi:hypothetical protein
VAHPLFFLPEVWELVSDFYLDISIPTNVIV